MYFPLDLLRDITSTVVGIVTAGVAVLTMLRARKQGGWRAFSSEPTSDLESTTAEIRKAIAEASPDASPESKQYILLREYHAQGIAQSKISFWFSLVFAALGFGVIIYLQLLPRNSAGRRVREPDGSAGIHWEVGIGGSGARVIEAATAGCSPTPARQQSGLRS